MKPSSYVHPQVHKQYNGEWGKEGMKVLQINLREVMVIADHKNALAAFCIVYPSLDIQNMRIIVDCLIFSFLYTRHKE